MYEHFTSLPPEQERAFIVYEQRMRQDSAKAMAMGLGIAGGLLALALVVVLAFWAPLKEFGPPAGETPAETAK